MIFHCEHDHVLVEEIPGTWKQLTRAGLLPGKTPNAIKLLEICTDVDVKFSVQFPIEVGLLPEDLSFNWEKDSSCLKFQSSISIPPIFPLEGGSPRIQRTVLGLFKTLVGVDRQFLISPPIPSCLPGGYTSVAEDWLLPPLVVDDRFEHITECDIPVTILSIDWFGLWNLTSGNFFPNRSINIKIMHCYINHIFIKVNQFATSVTSKKNHE